jgi:uncharacterized protein
MTNEERDIITSFISRISGAQAPQPTAPGSVPATIAPLPPVDREADQLINQLFTRYPDARYRLTQTAFVQEHALAEAQNRIQRLEWELQQAKQALAQAQQSTQQQSSGGGFFGGLFGGGRQSAPPPPPQGGAPAWNQGGPQQGSQQGYQQPPPYGAPPPQYPPGYQPGMFQRPGSGFLGSALTTAAGVAGGMVAGNALMNLFSGGHGGGGMFGGGTSAGLGAAPAASPWATPAPLPEPPAPPAQDYVDQGTWDTGSAAGGADPGSDWDRQSDSGWADSGGNDWGSGGSDDI